MSPRAAPTVAKWLPVCCVLALCLLQPSCASAKTDLEQEDDGPDASLPGGVAAVLNWTQQKIASAEQAYASWSEGKPRMESPAVWSTEVFYNAFVDRFANGNIFNDRKNIDPNQMQQMYTKKPYSVWNWRHGGDLQGVGKRLGYLKQLGISVIWLSPIFYSDSSAYHGYCPTNMLRVDPNFGTGSYLRQLVKEAHDLGIRVILDVVANHACAKTMSYQNPTPTIDSCTACAQAFENAYWRDQRSSPPPQESIPDPSQPSKSYTRSQLLLDSLPKYMRSQSFFTRCGPWTQWNGEKTIDHMTEAEKTREAFEQGQLWPEFFGAGEGYKYFELNTLDPDLQQLLTNIFKYWVAYADVDGFRVDATGHISADAALYMSTELRAYAQKLGKSNLYMIGEVQSPVAHPYLYVGKAGTEQNTLAVPNKLWGLKEELLPKLKQFRPDQQWMGMLGIYPQPELFYIRALAAGQDQFGAPHQAKDWWELQQWQRGIEDWITYQKQGGDQNVYNTWAMLENQDVLRLLAQVPGQGWDTWRLKAAIGWTMTSYAIPTLLYGTELAFNGMCTDKSGDYVIDPKISGDPLDQITSQCNYTLHSGENQDQAYARQDMFQGGPFLLGSAVSSVQQKAYIGYQLQEAWGPHWCQESLLDRSNEVFVLLQAMIRIRRSCSVLRTLSTPTGLPLRAAGADDNTMAFWSLDKRATVPAILVVISFLSQPNWTSLTLTVPDDAGYAEGTVMVDMLSQNKPRRTAIVRGGTVAFVPEAGSVVGLFAPQQLTKPDEPGTHLVCIGSVLPPFPQAEECAQAPLWKTALGVVVFFSAVTLVLLVNHLRSGVFLCLVYEPSAPEGPANPTDLPQDVSDKWPQHVFVAAIEHTIPPRKVKVSAGGLGKVLDQMLKEHSPTKLSLVHPRVGNVNYGETSFYTRFDVKVDGQVQDVLVHKIDGPMDGTEVVKVWYILEHPWFTKLTKEAPYPYPVTELSVLRFFSLWNQACAQLLGMLDPDVYHCMDYHAALIPLYLPSHQLVPTIIVLHNADYDGAIATDFINDIFFRPSPYLRRLSLIFNLDVKSIRRYLTFEGRFNMLYGGVSSLVENQKGYGVCTVSGRYAQELKRERTLFKGLPDVLPLDNAIDPASGDKPRTIKELKAQRAIAKVKLQQYCKLNPDPNAKILIFIGRWVKQKGVDHIALLTPAILHKYPDVQFVLAGPPGDPYGNYAQELLTPLKQEYPGRLFVVTEFFMIPPELRGGAHFCLMPSCSEPFGYVDVEFGLLGVPSLGCAIGGLGKMPGVYFRQQNSDSPDMLLTGFFAAVDHALEMKDEDYWRMAFAGLSAQFPFEVWRRNLQECYNIAKVHFVRKDRGDLTLDAETGLNVLQEWPPGVGYARAGSALGSRGYCPPCGLTRWRRRQAHDRKVLQQLQKMHVMEAREFLTQPVTEDRVRQIMRDFMQDPRGRETDADTLQGLISLADQKANEKNHISKFLMLPWALCSCFSKDSCLGIHVVIALGYIVSPENDVRLATVQHHWTNSAITFTQRLEMGMAQQAATAGGCLAWLYLSKQIPPHLLMLLSLFLNLVFYFSVESLSAGGFDAQVWCSLFLGFLNSSRLLFLIWNFSEDFKGGFQVAARRVAIVESFRSAVSKYLQAWDLATYSSEPPMTTPYVIICFLLAVLVNNAPSGYSSYTLPTITFFRKLASNRIFLLLTASMSMDALGSYAANHSDTWMAMNGWTISDRAAKEVISGTCIVVFVASTFFALHRMSIWGPWAMRDFTCMIPPGALLRSLAFYDLGHTNYRSWLFVLAVVLSEIIDVARFAAMFTAILSSLANKWYALFGGFLSMAAIAVCQGLSPVTVDLLGRLLTGGVSPVYDEYSPQDPQGDPKSLAKATFLVVWPLGLIGFGLQLVAFRYFNYEVPTYKGHGNWMPDGSNFGPGSETVKVTSVRQLQQQMAAVTLCGADSDTEEDEDEEGTELTGETEP